MPDPHLKKAMAEIRKLLHRYRIGDVTSAPRWVPMGFLDGFSHAVIHYNLVILC